MHSMYHNGDLTFQNLAGYVEQLGDSLSFSLSTDV